MNCCEPTIIPFNAALTSVVPYGPSLRDKHGDIPKVEVLYWDEDASEYYVSNNSTRVWLTGTPVDLISIDHGGSQTGIIKII